MSGDLVIALGAAAAVAEKVHVVMQSDFVVVERSAVGSDYDVTVVIVLDVVFLKPYEVAVAVVVAAVSTAVAAVVAVEGLAAY